LRKWGWQLGMIATGLDKPVLGSHVKKKKLAKVKQHLGEFL
jgi:hypothetical protein